MKRGLTFSYTLATVGLLLLGRIGPHADYLGVLLPGMLVMAFSQGISFPGLLNSALHRLDRGDAGLGSAVQATSLQIGGSLGLAILVTIALRDTASKIAHHVTPLIASTDGDSLAVKISAAIMFLGAITVAALFENVEFIPPDQIALDAAEASAAANTTTRTTSHLDAAAPV